MTSPGGNLGDVAVAYLETRNYRRAAEVLQSALAEDPDNAALLARYSQAMLGLKDYWRAASAAHAALGAPDNEHAMRLYTAALRGQRRLSEALWMAHKTVEAHPNSFRAHYLHASMLHDSGFDDDALTAINEALRLNPMSADSLVLRADISRFRWGRAAAEADYHAALQLEPDHASAVHNLAVSRLRWGKLTTAIRGFLGAGRLDPDFGPLARRNIGAVLIRVLRLTTASVIFLFVALAAITGESRDLHSTVLPRLFAAAVTLGLAAAMVWIVRSVPRPTLRAVLRERLLLGVRLAFVGFAIVVGLATVAVGSTPFTTALAPFLFIGAVGLTVVGWLVGQ